MGVGASSFLVGASSCYMGASTFYMIYNKYLQTHIRCKNNNMITFCKGKPSAATTPNSPKLSAVKLPQLLWPGTAAKKACFILT